jgi:rubrerythrin
MIAGEWKRIPKPREPHKFAVEIKLLSYARKKGEPAQLQFKEKERYKVWTCPGCGKTGEPTKDGGCTRCSTAPIDL